MPDLDNEGERIPDVFLANKPRVQAAITRIRNTGYYKRACDFYDELVFDTNNLVIGWWSTSTLCWDEVWAFCLEKHGPMQRWTYLPDPDIRIESSPSTAENLESLEEAPYFILKRLATELEKLSAS